ncbi:MAG: hypothetical protein K5910_01105 [Bacteroidales bacterium]|nr:hypothetical protein [Bacteroidales bacterium]
MLLLLTFAAPDAAAQLRRNRKAGTVYGSRVEKEAPAPPDSATLARRDSLHKADSLHRLDSIALLGKSSLELPAFSNAADSMISDFSNGRRKIYYYGETSVKYQDMELTANYMEYDLNSGVVYARGVYDSLAGEWVGRPVMTQGAQTYNMEEVRYNFNSRKARIKNMITTEDEGVLHGRDIKMMDDHSINMSHGQYTVCDADHPHYYIDMSVGKVIGQTRTTVFGPSHVVIEDVHLPFVGIPFGFIPKRPQRATGLLMPTFGEEEARGFYMRDLGMYFVFGDHFDLSLTGDYYTLGSWGVDVNSRYRVNYKFNGTLAFNFSNDQTGEKGTPEFYQTRNFGLRWSHSQDSKAHPGTSFSASVNFQSPSNSRYNSRSVNEAIQNQISSSISYAHNWNGKFNLSINALHSQNSRDSSYTFTLPNITFSMSTIYPFKIKNRVGKERFYEKISIGYNTTLQNKINFKASEFALNASMLDRFQNGMAHNFSIGLPNFQLLKYISFAPSVSYSQNWFFRKTEYVYNPETDAVEAQQGRQFGTLGITQNYSASASLSTRLYGMFNFGQHHRIQAIRHVISPSMSLSWSPEKGTYANGYRTLEYTDASGNEQTYQYNIYSGQIYSAPGRGQSATASLSIGNNLEAKVRDFADTTGTGTKKVKLIDQLTLNTSYNFLADSLRMNVISMSMSTSLFNKISISASAGFDPYAISDRGTRYNRFAIVSGQGLARLTNFTASASYSISGKGKMNGYDGTGSDGRGSSGAAGYYQRMYYHPVTGEYIPGGWLYYTNPDVPWSANFSTSFSLFRSYRYDTDLSKLAWDNRITATLNASGNIRLTPKMSINMSTGFDFVAKQITTTSISATYDLHCFNIAVSWIPTGTWKSYSFRIAANAAALADLLRFKKSDSYWDN